MKKPIALFALFVFLGAQLLAQTNEVSGTVTSSDDGMPIPGVTVIVKGTTVGIVSDIDGLYTLQVPENATILLFSFVGMKTQEVDIGNRSTIDIVMESDVLGIDEVIVTAFGTSKKGTFTGSASQINSEAMELRPVTNVTTAIEGSAAGVIVTAPNGQPGSSQDIRVRGFGSYSASSAPLYVVDGVPYSGALNSISPADIESITILKDASSTALYGNRAANGVVLITTKKGRAGKGQLSINVSAGVTSRAQEEYNRIDAFEYYPIMWEAYRNSMAIPGIDDPADVATANQTASDGIFGHLGYNPFNVPDDQIVGLDGKMNPNAQFKGAYGEDRDWEGGVSQTGQRQNYDVSYSGATDKVDYFLSVGHLNERGWIIESDFKRYSGRANINVQATNWLKTGVNIGATQSAGNQAQTGGSSSYVNPIRFTRQMGPIYPIHALDPVTGEYILDSDGNKIYDLNDNRTSNSSTGRHVIAEIKWDEDLEERTQLMAKTYAEITFLKDFKFTANFSFDQDQFYNTYYNNKYIGDGAPGGRGMRNYVRRNSVNLNQLLNYTKSFGNHNIIALLGHETFSYDYNRLYGWRSEIIADGNTELGNFVTTTTLDSYMDTYRSEGYFARLDYNYNNRFFVTGSYRRDGSSKFHPDNQWGDFFSVGVAWRLDQEGFIQDVSWINMLKLRGSYGQVGNDAGIDWYAYQALYALGWNNQSESGVYQDKLMADALQWESNNSFDIAVEFGLFNRLYGTIEFYHRISDNLLFEVPLPLSGGMDSQDQNIGTLYNQGIEIQLSWDIIKTNDFTWNLDANFSTLKNEFTYLPQEEIIDGSKKLMVGHSRYDYWLKEWVGVDPDDGENLFRADVYSDTDTDIRIQGSDTLTIDQNNARYGYFDTSIPDLYGAFTNTLTFKGFTLNFMFTYQIGGKVIDYNYRSIMSSGDYGASKSVDIMNRWQKPGDVTNIPRMDVTNTTNTEATSTRWLTDASFINLRQVTLAYNVPQKLTGSWSKGLRVYVSGENLFISSKRQGMNVQQNFSGTTSNVYTPSRVITFGINLNL